MSIHQIYTPKKVLFNGLGLKQELELNRIKSLITR
jgi:hypothetical protein